MYAAQDGASPLGPGDDVPGSPWPVSQAAFLSLPVAVSSRHLDQRREAFRHAHVSNALADAVAVEVVAAVHGDVVAVVPGVANAVADFVLLASGAATAAIDAAAAAFDFAAVHSAVADVAALEKDCAHALADTAAALIAAAADHVSVKAENASAVCCGDD